VRNAATGDTRPVVRHLGRLPLIVVLALGCIAVATSASAGTRTASAGTVVKVTFNKQLKKSILVDARGFTLYSFLQDPKGTPTCYNDQTYHCSKAWPPLLTTGAPRAGHGVRSSLLGTAKRDGGGLQVTYHGMPLYRDAGAKLLLLTGDKKPGDVNGQTFGGLWFAVAPSGKPISR
jgi:predicted lipoprotein with Yx(FWY)xxD motif